MNEAAGWHEICNWVKYPNTLFHSKYGDRYPIVLTKSQEKSPNLRGKTVGRGGPQTTAEQFHSCKTYQNILLVVIGSILDLELILRLVSHFYETVIQRIFARINFSLRNH